MSNKQSSFHMGDEFNGYGQMRYLKGTRPEIHPPLSQENVRLSPDFGDHLLKMLGSIPTVINPDGANPNLRPLLGSMASVNKVIIRKNESAGTYNLKFNVMSDQDLTDGSYPYIEKRDHMVPVGYRPFDTAIVYYIDDFKREANWRAEKLKEDFGIDATMISLTLPAAQDTDGKQTALGFANSWNTMDDSETIDMIYIFCHASERMLQFVDGSAYNALTIDGWNKKKNEKVAGNLHSLKKKDIVRLYLQACNAGLVDYYKVEGKNVASIMSTKLADDSAVYAWNGSVSFGPPAVIQDVYGLVDADYDFEPRVSENQDHYDSVIKDLKSEGLIETATGPMGEVVYHKGDYCPYGYIPGTYLTAKEA
ncbi:hypothetical protein ADH76_11420 [Enterocloster clostridioformis]|uniref:hypothetical protein n=2 Tax=Bacteria TaxID=2 RepID=UPI00080C5E64|nr:hypothetical protein [Enterocloster clostridioformis]ANU48278.1 hypothetical protein A4V08_23190 [Lachnoclostridium sp. YL32]NDO29478.1 hypothetical protein [Enterocloster clostridioformis]OXE69016.1 hypothetical protein ADH76_11420 [Enterocloster clostridioformis]QQR02833.1 hypothetical protein I5Q83_11620 [Enterocloster clostridioformis]